MFKINNEMTLTNQRTSYTVEHSNEFLKLSGQLSINSESNIENFSGSFQALEGQMVNNGGFSYSDNGLTLNKSIHNIPMDLEEIALDLLDEAVIEIKLELNK